MICQNPACREQIDDDSTFCVRCGATQTAEEQTVVRPPAPPAQPVQARTVQPPPAARVSSGNRYVEFRASDNIWNFTESEPTLVPEQRRPVLILDEQTILLDETSKHLSYEELLARVQQIIHEKNVPIESYIAQARWVNDQYEVRPRIIAELRDHAYSGLKMVLALDYMGNWATLQFQIGMQPDAIPKPPPSVSSGSQTPQLLMVFGGIFGVIGMLMTVAGFGGNSGGIGLGGLVMMLSGGAMFFAGLQQFNQMNQNIDLQKKERERVAREQYQQALYKARMELFRTFKIDDAHLFREAMEKVFKQVVDDIIAHGGGKIVKEIKGGDDSMFDIQAAPGQTSLTGVMGSNQSVGGKVATVATAVAKHGVKDKLGLDI